MKDKETDINKSDKRYRQMYLRWHNMVARCTKPSNKSFQIYGGRGISVCSEWLSSIDVFIRDMGYPPTSKYQIDRIDNDGDYSPANCRWSTRTANMRNNRATKLHECEVRDIRRYLAQGKDRDEIAAAYHVAPTTISNIKSEHTWKGVR